MGVQFVAVMSDEFAEGIVVAALGGLEQLALSAAGTVPTAFFPDSRPAVIVLPARKRARRTAGPK